MILALYKLGLYFRKQDDFRFRYEPMDFNGWKTEMSRLEQKNLQQCAIYSSKLHKYILCVTGGF